MPRRLLFGVGRKFVLAIMCLIAGLTIAVVKPASFTTEFVSFLLGLVGIFSAGNFASKRLNGSEVESQAFQPVADSFKINVDEVSTRVSVLEEGGRQLVEEQRKLSAAVQTLASLITKTGG